MTLVLIPLVLIPLALVFAFLMLVFVSVLGVTAVAFGVVRAMPWVLILVGLWLLLRGRYGGHHRRYSQVSRPQLVAVAQPAPAEQVEPPPAVIEAEVTTRRELPIDVQVKVEQIRRKVDVLLGYADRFPPFSYDLHIVRQTTAEYLPRTIDTYLALPGNDDPIMANGKTAQEELREQLQLLDTKLDEIVQALQKQDLDRMMANRRFLEERFHHPLADDFTEPRRHEPDAA